jgi:hypothetical protein
MPYEPQSVVTGAGGRGAGLLACLASAVAGLVAVVPEPERVGVGSCVCGAGKASRGFDVGAGSPYWPGGALIEHGGGGQEEAKQVG